MIYTVFVNVVEMAITATVVILAVLFARIFLGRFPKKYSYALWLIVGIRLLCPFGMSSSVSVFNLFGEHDLSLSIYQTEETAGAFRENAGAVKNGSGQQMIQQKNGEMPDVLDAGGRREASGIKKTEYENAGTQKENALSGSKKESSGAAIKNERDAERKRTESVLKKLNPVVKYGVIVWLGVFSCLVLWNLFLLWQMKRRVAKGIHLKENIYECDGIPSPFVMGFVQPKIYIPFRLGEEEREYIIRHEKYHMKRRDNFIKLLAFFIACVYWFHPLVWVSYLLFIRDMEMSCDEYVLKKSAKDIRADYSKSLLGFSTNQRNLGVGFLAFGESDTRRRVKHIMKFKEFGKWAGVLAVVVILVVGTVCLTNAKEDTKEKKTETAEEKNGNTLAKTEKVLAETEIHGYQVRVLYLSDREEKDIRTEKFGEETYYTGEKGTGDRFVIETGKEGKRVDFTELNFYAGGDDKCYFPEFSLGVADYDGDGETDDFAIGQGQTIDPNFGNFMTYQFFGIEDDGDVTKYHTSTENGVSISTPPGDFSPVPNEKDGYSPILKAENGEVTYTGLGAADSEPGIAGETTTRIIRMVPVADLPDEHSEKQGDSLERKLYELTNQVYEFVPDRGVKEELANHGVWHTGIYMDENGQKLRSYSLANSEDYDKVTLRLDFTFDVDGNLVDYVSKDYGFIEGLDAAENTEDPLHGIKRFADMFLDFYVVDGEKAVTLADEDEDLESLLADEETEERRILWLWEEGLPKKYEGLDYAYYSDGYNHHYLVDKRHDMLLRFESPESFGGGRISGDNKTDLWKSGILAKDATIDLGESKLYTKEDRMAAVQVIVEEFKNHFTDCELKELTYTSDECNCGENLRWMNQFAEGYEEFEELANGKKPVFTQCIEFKGCYHSNTHGDGSLDIGDYPDWRWWLAREENGEWHLMTQGY